MERKIINIDSYIGRWGYGKELLRFDLEGTQKEGALLRISSLGGDVFHALDMYNQIAAHGNVEVLFAGPSASAATFLAMAACKVSIVDNCFLLVHKVMAGVDSFGMFNEDELDALIRDLRLLKKENQQFDKAIAHIYSKRTGRPHQEMIDRMKQGTWISAQQALELGFVDQVVEPDEKVNYYSPRFVAMVTSSELPPFPGCAPVGANYPGANGYTNENEDMTRQFTRVNQILGVDSLESSGEGVYLNQEQLEQLDQGLEALMQAQLSYDAAIAQRDASREAAVELTARVDQLTLEIQAANSERDASREQQLTDAEIHREMSEEFRQLSEAINAIDPSVLMAGSPQAKADAIRTLLAALPGAPVPGILDRHDPKPSPDGVDWELIARLPHNFEADKNL